MTTPENPGKPVARKNAYKRCVAWRVSPGNGYACKEMCSAAQRQQCMIDFRDRDLEESRADGNG